MITLNVCEGFALAEVNRPGVVYAYLDEALAAVEAVSASATTSTETKPRPGLPQRALERVSPFEGLPQRALCRRSPFVPRSSRIRCSPCPFPSPPSPQGRVGFERQTASYGIAKRGASPFRGEAPKFTRSGISAPRGNPSYGAQDAAAQLAAFQLAAAHEAAAQLAAFQEAEDQLAWFQEALAQLAWFQEAEAHEAWFQEAWFQLAEFQEASAVAAFDQLAESKASAPVPSATTY